MEILLGLLLLWGLGYLTLLLAYPLLLYLNIDPLGFIQEDQSEHDPENYHVEPLVVDGEVQPGEFIVVEGKE